jgi:hypothetical protein
VILKQAQFPQWDMPYYCALKVKRYSTFYLHGEASLALGGEIESCVSIRNFLEVIATSPEVPCLLSFVISEQRQVLGNCGCACIVLNQLLFFFLEIVTFCALVSDISDFSWKTLKWRRR